MRSCLLCNAPRTRAGRARGAHARRNCGVHRGRLASQREPGVAGDARTTPSRSDWEKALPDAWWQIAVFIRAISQAHLAIVKADAQLLALQRAKDAGR